MSIFMFEKGKVIGRLVTFALKIMEDLCLRLYQKQIRHLVRRAICQTKNIFLNHVA